MTLFRVYEREREDESREFLFSFVLILLTLQENRSLATEPFRRTKVSISSLDVPGDEIVH